MTSYNELTIKAVVFGLILFDISLVYLFFQILERIILN